MLIKSAAAGKFKISDSEIDALIAAIDVNGDDVIQVEEFEQFLNSGNYKTGIINDTLMLSKEKVERVRDFMAVKFDSFEEVSISTFANMIKEVCTGEFEMSDSEVNALISLIDENGDGV